MKGADVEEWPAGDPWIHEWIAIARPSVDVGPEQSESEQSWRFFLSNLLLASPAIYNYMSLTELMAFLGRMAGSLLQSVPTVLSTSLETCKQNIKFGVRAFTGGI